MADDKNKVPTPAQQTSKPPDKSKAPESPKASVKTESPKSPTKKEAPKPKEATPKPIEPPKAEPPKQPPKSPPLKEPPKPEKPADKSVPPKESAKPEQVVQLDISKIKPFKNHPFEVRQDGEMEALIASIRDKGISQPAIVRPTKDGGFEMVSGHRRQMACGMAGMTQIPCIVRNLTDDEAITQMVEDNFTQRDSVLPSERAKALKMQYEAIARQGKKGDAQHNSHEIVGERNNMTGKQVQRFIKLNDLSPDLMKMLDSKKLSFTPALEISFINPKNQVHIASAIEGAQSAPSLSQAQRMREMDKKNLLTPDAIDGIMLEQKKEVDTVLLPSKDLQQFFPKNTTPKQMQQQIFTLLQEWSKTQNKEKSEPSKGGAR